MFSPIKQVLIVLLSFSESLAHDRTKCLFLNVLESCNVLSLKIYVPKETKDLNVKAFNMITNKNEAETMAKHVSCDCKCKFNSTARNSNQKWNNKTGTCECKSYH